MIPQFVYPQLTCPPPLLMLPATTTPPIQPQQVVIERVIEWQAQECLRALANQMQDYLKGLLTETQFSLACRDFGKDVLAIAPQLLLEEKPRRYFERNPFASHDDAIPEEPPSTQKPPRRRSPFTSREDAVADEVQRLNNEARAAGYQVYRETLDSYQQMNAARQNRMH